MTQNNTILHNEQLTNAINVPEFSLDGITTHAYCNRVYDGDTFWIRAPISVAVHDGIERPITRIVKIKCRLAGLDTSEIRGGSALSKQLGTLAADYLRDLIEDKMCTITFGAFDLYGRVLTTVRLINDAHDATEDNKTTVNDMMISAGHAIEYDGRGTRKAVMDEEYELRGMKVDDIIAVYADIAK